MVVAAHFVLLALFPERHSLEERGETPAGALAVGPLKAYLDSGSYWLGLSYALALAFAATALRRYREQHLCAARNVAIGGVSFCGGLVVGGCTLLGCCGSPMLGVYMSLFGSWFLPLTRPMVAAVTALTVAGSWAWLNRSGARGS